jgi:hypothetical protein
MRFQGLCSEYLDTKGLPDAYLLGNLRCFIFLTYIVSYYKSPSRGLIVARFIPYTASPYSAACSNFFLENRLSSYFCTVLTSKAGAGAEGLRIPVRTTT